MLELACVVLSVICAWRFGVSVQTAAALIYTWSLLVLTGIDLEHQILPDIITMPILWLGLLLTLPHVFVNSHSAIIGATLGYLILWFLAWAFHRITGKVGMGYGDFKLLAMIGAWVGWQATPLVILLASALGSGVGLTLIALKKHQRSMPISFGPYLAIAGWVALLWNEKLLQLYWQIVN
jgi:leader peptidase (prepilin peptidase)/N-methyltransferase